MVHRTSTRSQTCVLLGQSGKPSKERDCQVGNSTKDTLCNGTVLAHGVGSATKTKQHLLIMPPTRSPAEYGWVDNGLDEATS